MFNLPAAIIVLLVAALLVIGIKQSADTNTLLVAIKAMVLVVFVVAGAAYVNRDNLTPFIPPNTGAFGQFGWSGVLRGAGVMFFAYIGFDAVSTAAQEAKNPSRDMPIGILGSLAICTVIYIAVAIVLLGHRAVSAAERRRSARRRHRRHRTQVAEPGDQDGGALRPLQHDARQPAGADADLLLDEPRRPAAAGVCRGASALPHAAREHHPDRHRSSRWSPG